MSQVKTGYAVVITCFIGGIDISGTFKRMEWKAMINNGYIVRTSVLDPGFNILQKVTDQVYLRRARREPIEVKFSFGWKTADGVIKTEERLAYMINLYSGGVGDQGTLEFIAIDPPTWMLSRGRADGKHYTGSVSDVIRQVCTENGVNDVSISNTIDNKNGDWWMMRQDPKTFILSLLNWSSSITPNKTKWIVTSKDKRLVIKEEHDYKSEDLGVKTISAKTKDEASDQAGFEMLMDNFTHVMHSEVHTAGLSSTSGQYIDIKTEKDKAKIYDKNTGSKTNTNFGDDRGFSVTDKEWSTYIDAIPEDSAGGIGIKYSDYADGCARGAFLGMVGYITRMKVKLSGDPVFDDPTKLGTSTVTLQWQAQDRSYFLSGPWLVTGFYHVIERSGWYTNIFINRLDYDAAARKVGPGRKK